MKLFFFLLFCISYNLISQETLLGDGEFHSGGFGSPVFQMTKINNDLGFIAGGRGAWVINHQFTIGGGGFGILNKLSLKDDLSSSGNYGKIGYGGLELGYFLFPEKLIHFYFSVMIGGGQIEYDEKESMYYSSRGRNSDNKVSFFAVQPNIEIMLNITKFMKLGIGINYRYFSNFNYYGLTNKDFNYPSGSISLNFGKY